MWSILSPVLKPWLLIEILLDVVLTPTAENDCGLTKSFWLWSLYLKVNVVDIDGFTLMSTLFPDNNPCDCAVDTITIFLKISPVITE